MTGSCLANHPPWQKAKRQDLAPIRKSSEAMIGASAAAVHRKISRRCRTRLRKPMRTAIRTISNKCPLLSLVLDGEEAARCVTTADTVFAEKRRSGLWSYDICSGSLSLRSAAAARNTARVRFCNVLEKRLRNPETESAPHKWPSKSITGTATAAASGSRSLREMYQP